MNDQETAKCLKLLHQHQYYTLTTDHEKPPTTFPGPSQNEAHDRRCPHAGAARR